MERQPQAVFQGSLWILMQEFPRLKILFSSTFGIELNVIIGITWTISVLGIIKSWMRCSHRKRFPVEPAIVGSLLQTIAIGCLLVPKLIVISISLLNTLWIYPLIQVFNICVVQFIHKGLLRNELTTMDVLLHSVAPAYYHLPKNDQGDESEAITSKLRKFSLTFVVHIIGLMLCFVICWTLRHTVFFFNIKLDQSHGTFNNSASFLNDIAINQSTFPFHWQIVTYVYIGFLLLYYLFSILYYKYGHPHWTWEWTANENIVVKQSSKNSY